MPRLIDILTFLIRTNCIYHAKNVKMPTIVGILTFLSRMISGSFEFLEQEKIFITLGPDFVAWEPQITEQPAHPLVYVEWAKKIVPCKFRDDFWRPI